MRRGPHLVAADKHMYIGSQFGQVQRFFGGGVSCTDDGDFLAPEKEPIAYRTGADPIAIQSLFAFQAQPFCRGAGGDDDGIGPDQLFFVDPDLKRTDGKIHFGGQPITYISSHLAGRLFFQK